MVEDVRLAPLILALFTFGCAGYTSISVNCAPIDQSGVAGGAAASCGTITVSGNTPTATATTTVPVQAPIGPGAGLGLGGSPLPALPMVAHGAMVIAPPQPQAAAVPRARRAPQVLSMGPPKKTSDLETVPWPEFWRRTTTRIRALDEPRLDRL